MTRRTQRWPTGCPAWIDVLTTDADGSRAFYAGLFGWKWSTETLAGLSYSTATLHGASVAGSMAGPPGHPTVWNTYLACDDAEATVAAAQQHGAELLEPVATAGERARFAVVRDPAGAVVCLYESLAHIGCERANEPGALVWNELVTRDSAAAQDFYTAVFGVTFTEIGDDTFSFATMEADGRTVGGIGVLPPDTPDDVPPHWRLYFQTPDVDAVTARATDLGATVGVDAHDSPFGRWATLVDPQGGRFSVISPATPG